LALPKDHGCEWQGLAVELQAKVDSMQQRLAQLEKHVIGPQTEKRKKTGKMPPPVPPTPAPLKVAREKDDLRHATLDTEVIPVHVAAEKAKCPECANDGLRAIGSGKTSTIYDYVAPHFRRRVFVRQTLACSCGEYVVTAPAPERVGEKTQYSASFVAHTIVTKCADNRAQYNLSKEYARIGIPISRSTINAIFHRAGTVLGPLFDRLFQRIKASEVVLADETSLRIQRVEKKAFIWAFLGGPFVGYRFSTDRSGHTPSDVLGDSAGWLVCDAYTGYNKLMSAGRRERGGCLAHARRKIFEAKEHPEAGAALDLIGQIYVTERAAKIGNFVGTETHAELRRAARSPFAKLLWWAREQRRTSGPKSLLGRAARYIVNNFRPLGLFLRTPLVPIDNNRSEAALRRVALGRKNFLFVGHAEAGERLAGLYSLVASCEANGVNPIAYLTDVLTRIDRPGEKVDDLLPDAWRPP
jgi:transposase